MKGKLNDRWAECPFLRYVTKNELFCESPLAGYGDEDCYSKLYFKDDENRRRHYREYCCRNWKMCEVARAVMDKYDEDPDNL